MFFFSVSESPFLVAGARIKGLGVCVCACSLSGLVVSKPQKVQPVTRLSLEGICVYMQRMLSMSWPRSPKTNPAPPLEGNLSSFAMMSHGAVDQSDARVAREFCHLLFPTTTRIKIVFLLEAALFWSRVQSFVFF